MFVLQLELRRPLSLAAADTVLTHASACHLPRLTNKEHAPDQPLLFTYLSTCVPCSVRWGLEGLVMNQPLIQARHAQPSREKPNQGGEAAAVCNCRATPAQPSSVRTHRELKKMPAAPAGHMMPPCCCGRLCHAALLNCLVFMPVRLISGCWKACLAPALFGHLVQALILSRRQGRGWSGVI